jgi:hypothetical protein
MRRRDALWTLAALQLAPTIAPALAMPRGRTFTPSLPAAPFPAPNRAAGHLYNGVLYDAATHYSDSTVGIYVPPQFRAGSSLDAVVHFHGWSNHVAEVFRRYRLREQLDASGLNAVLVVPQGPKDAPDSDFGKVEHDPGDFARLMQEVVAFLNANGYAGIASMGDIVLTSHSGGYGGAGGALSVGGLNDAISDVILFDSAYGYYDAFASWANGSPGRHLLSLFTADTATGNAVLMSKVQAPTPNLFVRDAATMTLAELLTRAPTFVITTTVAHDDLLQRYDWFELFLKSTALKRSS